MQAQTDHGCAFGYDAVQPFTLQSQKDFEDIQALVKPLRITHITNDSGFGFKNNGHRQLVFHVQTLPFHRLSYIYAPNHGITKTDGLSNEIILTPINQDWIRIDEDWN